MSRSASAFVLALALAATGLHAQDRPATRSPECRRDDDSDDRYAHYCETRTLSLTPGGTLSFSASPNGGVMVTGWNRDSIAVRASIHTRAGSDRDARALAADVRVVVTGRSVRADGPSTGRHESWWVELDVMVPAHTDFTATSVNGPVSAYGVKGTISLRTENGPVSVSDAGGDVRATTVNGPLVVSLSGSKWDGAGLDGRTTNGPVRLTIPEGYSAELEAGTSNGPMSVDFPITVQGRNLGKRIQTTLGGGGPTIRVGTTNGPLVLSRR